jgi:GNAT superfamily N-acetyltransferase
MSLKLVEIDRHSASARAEVVEFVNKTLVLGLPLDEDAVRLGKIILFWATEGDQRVGVTGFYHKTQFLAETAKTVIAPEHRGRGLGVELSQAIEDEVRRRGYKKVATTIYVTNLPMIFIKLRQGYYFEGFHRDHDRPGLHEYSMGKIFEEADRIAAEKAAQGGRK